MIACEDITEQKRAAERCASAGGLAHVAASRPWREAASSRTSGSALSAGDQATPALFLGRATPISTKCAWLQAIARAPPRDDVVGRIRLWHPHHIEKHPRTSTGHSRGEFPAEWEANRARAGFDRLARISPCTDQVQLPQVCSPASDV